MCFLNNCTLACQLTIRNISFLIASIWQAVVDIHISSHYGDHYFDNYESSCIHKTGATREWTHWRCYIPRPRPRPPRGGPPRAPPRPYRSDGNVSMLQEKEEKQDKARPRCGAPLRPEKREG